MRGSIFEENSDLARTVEVSASIENTEINLVSASIENILLVKILDALI